MKKIIFLLALFTVCTLNAIDVWIHDAGNPANNQGDWTARYWRIMNSIEPDTFESPFYSYLYSNLDFLNHGANSDFNETDGWRLIQLYLGNSILSDHPNPFVILYNENTGILRYFFRKKEIIEHHNTAIAQLSVSTNTGILASVHTDTGMSLALDRRNEFISVPIMKIIEGYMDQWNFADFYLAYDDAVPLPTDRLRFDAAVVNVYNLNLDIFLSSKTEHTVINAQTNNTSSLFSIGRTITDYLGLGNSLRDGIINLQDDLGNMGGATTGFTNFLNTGVSALTTWGIVPSLPYVSLFAGILNVFSGNRHGVSTSMTTHTFTSEITGNITGTMSIDHSIVSFTMAIPSPHPSNANIQSMYQETLGIINVDNSPKVEKWVQTNSGYTSYRYRLKTEPIEWKINPLSDLANDTSNIAVQVSYSFSVITGRPLTNNSYKDFIAIGDNDFIIHYKTSYDTNNYPIYHFYTHFLDYELANNMLIVANIVDITDFAVKLKAVFHNMDPSIEPYVYISNLKPTILPPTNTNTQWTSIATQRIKHLTNNAIFSPSNNTNQNGELELGYHFIVDHGADVIISYSPIVPLNIPLYTNDSFGFTVRSGRLYIGVPSISTPLGYLKAIGEHSLIEMGPVNITPNSLGLIEVTDGGKLVIDSGSINFGNIKIVADGAHSEIHLNRIQNTVYMKNIHITNGAKLFINGTNVDMTDGSITISGNNSSLYIVNSSSVTLSGINSAMTLSGLSAITISTNSHLNLQNNSTLIMNDSSNMTLNNGHLSFHDSTLNMRYDYEYFDFMGRIGILMNNNSTLTANNSNLYVSNRSDIISTNSEINILNNSS
ncbi:MAG: hypothetical protein FWG98_14670, partial [Candidatus Cloacimonetes bacterium]|nr:hypothetical protein [Candidatus Cloacimonadota bacterium]